MLIDYELAEMLLSNAIAEKGEDYVYQAAVFAREIDSDYLYDDENDDVGEFVPEGTVVVVEEEECAYFDQTGVPSCGVGCAIAQLPFVSARTVEPWNIGVGFDSLADFLKNDGFDFTPKAVSLLGNFQSLQDQRWAWGDAFDEAQARTAHMYSKDERIVSYGL
jgi:hypothetical protein